MAEDKKVEKDAKKPAKDGKSKKPRKNPFKSIASFFKSVNAERKKVVWPTAKETLKNAAIVLVVTVIVGVAIYAIDSLLSLGMEQLRNWAPEKTTVSTSVESASGDADEDTTGDAAEGTTGNTTEGTTGSTEGSSENSTEGTSGN